MNIGGAGDHVANANIRIKRIKDTCRTILDGIPYNVAIFLLKYLDNFLS